MLIIANISTFVNCFCKRNPKANENLGKIFLYVSMLSFVPLVLYGKITENIEKLKTKDMR